MQENVLLASEVYSLDIDNNSLHLTYNVCYSNENPEIPLFKVSTKLVGRGRDQVST